MNSDDTYQNVELWTTVYEGMDAGMQAVINQAAAIETIVTTADFGCVQFKAKA